MKIKRAFCTLIAVASLLALVFGCSKPATDAVTDSISTVVIWHSSSDQIEDALNKIVAEYNETHTNVIVTAINQPSSGFVDSIYSAVANGVGPDIIFNFATMAADFIPDNKIVNLGKYIDLEWLKGAVPQAIFDESTSFPNGDLYCLPLHSSGPVLFINKDVYNELDLTVPSTWDELVSASKIVYDETGKPGFLADSLIDLMQTKLLQDGSGYIDTANRVTLINNEKAESSYQWLVDNVKSGYFTVDKVGERGYEDFNAGLVAAYLGSCGHVEMMKDNSFAFEIVPIPQGGVKDWAPIWNRSLIVFTSTEEKERAACDFIKFFVAPENSANWTIATGNISPYYDTASVTKYSDYLNNNRSLVAVNESFKVAGYLPAVIGSSTVREEIEKVALQTISGQKSIGQALGDAEIICNAALQDTP